MDLRYEPTLTHELKEGPSTAGSLPWVLPYLSSFGIKYQFHAADNSWQVLQRCPLQTKNREGGWASRSLANVNTNQPLWRTRGTSRRQHFQMRSWQLRHNRDRGVIKSPLIHKQWRLLHGYPGHIIMQYPLKPIFFLLALWMPEKWKLKVCCSVVSDFCDLHGLQSVRLLSTEFSKQEQWSGLPVNAYTANKLLCIFSLTLRKQQRIPVPGHRIHQPHCQQLQWLPLFHCNNDCLCI